MQVGLVRLLRPSRRHVACSFGASGSGLSLAPLLDCSTFTYTSRSPVWSSSGVRFGFSFVCVFRPPRSRRFSGSYLGAFAHLHLVVGLFALVRARAPGCDGRPRRPLRGATRAPVQSLTFGSVGGYGLGPGVFVFFRLIPACSSPTSAPRRLRSLATCVALCAR